MQTAILLYDGITALDAVGPYEVLSRLPGNEVRFVAGEPGPKATENGMLSLVADHSLEDVRSPEIVVVPGGFGNRRLLDDEQLLGWIRTAHETSRWTTSVCTGSLLLGAAGILRGLRATSHWLSLDRMAEFGAEPTSERVVEQGKVITAAGVSSGIDMALRLVQQIAGDEAAQAIQLSIEYDPEPPFDAGSPAKAPKHIVDLVSAASAEPERQPGSA
jgi:putative intracellular protease/amidase